MLKQYLVACCVAVAVVAAQARTQAAETYNIDGAHTSVGFSIQHMVISKVKGRFNEFSGTIQVDPKAESKVTGASVVIKVSSIDTANTKRDEHLRSADFFDVAKYPDMTFALTKVEKDKEGLVAHGKLTMHGVTKEISLPFKLNGPITDPWGNSRLGIEARTTLNRKDYGLTWSKTLETGGLVVGDEVEIEILLEAVKAKE
jgi:polyisoprenoid-binding protein YceI